MASVLVHCAGSESGTMTVQLTSMLQESSNSLVSGGHCMLFITMTINSAEILVLLSVLGYRGSACHQRRSHSETWHLIHSDTTSTSTQGNASATKEALKQLLPLMVYPLIFFLLSLIHCREDLPLYIGHT